MTENLKAFENLKENENASLSAQEKADLRKISPDDIRTQKYKVGDKAFTVGGKSMKLKDIVKSLTFDEEGSKAEFEVNGKKVTIGWQSELGAAIQVYAIANNKTIGRAGIDGKVGKDTVKGLQSTQNAVKAEEAKKQKEKPEDSDEVKEQSPERLLNAIFTEYVGKYKDSKYNLLRTNAGVNTGTLKNVKLNDKIASIKYKSQKGDKSYQTINLNVDSCKVGKQYSVDKFGKAIENAITKKENNVDNESKGDIVKNGVEKFGEDKVKDAVIKKWVNLKNLSFESNKYGNEIKVKDGNGKLVHTFYTRSDILLDDNGKFSPEKFNNILETTCYMPAKLEVRGDVDKTFKYLKQTKTTPASINNRTSRDSLVTECKTLSGDITKLGHTKDFKDLKDNVDNWSNYIEKAGKVSEVTGAVTFELRGFGNPNFERLLKDINEIVSVETVGVGKLRFDYKKNPVSEAYNKVGQRAKYIADIDKLANVINGKKIKVLGGDITYQVEKVNNS